MRLCSYTVVHDTGFAPNPFWGLCTLAACTPNHMGVHLEGGDWLLGHSTAARGHRLIYAMRISEILDFDAYYRDLRFDAKKAHAWGWRRRCGDNIYFRNAAGEWLQGRAFYHTSSRAFAKDTRYPRVFISDHFFYFGENACEIPVRFSSLIRRGRGCSCSHEAKVIRAFIGWLEGAHSSGVNGEPRDREQSS